MLWFDPEPDRPNSMAPGKRPLCNICPVVVTRDGKPWFLHRRLGRPAHRAGGHPARTDADRPAASM